MELKDIKFGLTKERYYHIKEDRIGLVLNSHFDDGATLIFEALDLCGDIMSGYIFTCEARDLQVCVKEIWEDKYPISESNLKFEGD